MRKFFGSLVLSLAVTGSSSLAAEINFTNFGGALNNGLYLSPVSASIRVLDLNGLIGAIVVCPSPSGACDIRQNASLQEIASRSTAIKFEKNDVAWQEVFNDNASLQAAIPGLNLTLGSNQKLQGSATNVAAVAYSGEGPPMCKLLQQIPASTPNQSQIQWITGAHVYVVQIDTYTKNGGGISGLIMSILQIGADKYVESTGTNKYYFITIETLPVFPFGRPNSADEQAYCQNQTSMAQANAAAAQRAAQSGTPKAFTPMAGQLGINDHAFAQSLGLQ